MLLANGFQNGTGDFFQCQSLADRRFDAAVIAQGERARQRIAGLSAANTDLFLRSERYGAQLQAGPAQINQRFLGDGTADRAGGQIIYAFEFSLTQGFDRREQDGDGFTDAGGSGEKQLATIGEHAIGSHRKLSLARPKIWERKSKRSGGGIAGEAPVM